MIIRDPRPGLTAAIYYKSQKINQANQESQVTNLTLCRLWGPLIYRSITYISFGRFLFDSRLELT
jgi:hypothetical protein